MSNPPLLFSVIIPSRNRPDVCQRAIHSVLAQTLTQFEIIVVCDGALTQYEEAYRTLCNTDPRIKLHMLPQRQHGHGPSFARNTGVSLSRGKYIAFLDDDDLWSDSEHLHTAEKALENADNPQVYFTHQFACFADGTEKANGVWVDESHYQSFAKTLTAQCVSVDARKLLEAGKFCHLNCTILSRELFDKAGGFDEHLRYEEDKDLYFRVLRASDSVLFSRQHIARHFVPVKSSASTDVQQKNKLLYQLSLYQKALTLFPTSRRIKLDLYYVLQHLCSLAIKETNSEEAQYWAKMALAVNFNIKWALYVLKLHLLKR